MKPDVPPTNGCALQLGQEILANKLLHDTATENYGAQQNGGRDELSLAIFIGMSCQLII